MEKYFSLSTAIMVVFLSLSAVADRQMSAAFQECKTKEGITDEDFKSFRNSDQQKTQAHMCFITCLGEQFGKLANNQINDAGILSSIKTLPNYSPEMEQKVNEILAECKGIADPKVHRCVIGSEAMTCLKERAKKRGLQGVFMPRNRS